MGLGSSGDGLREADGGDLFVLVVGKGGGGGDDDAIDEDVAGMDFEFVGVEGDGAGVFVDVETGEFSQLVFFLSFQVFLTTYSMITVPS